MYHQTVSETTHLRTDLIQRLRARINGDDTTTNDEGNLTSDTQRELESDDQNQSSDPNLKTLVLEDIKRWKKEKDFHETCASETEALKEQYNEEGELSAIEEEMTNVTRFEDSDFEEAALYQRDSMRSLTPPSPCYSKYIQFNSMKSILGSNHC